MRRIAATILILPVLLTLFGTPAHAAIAKKFELTWTNKKGKEVKLKIPVVARLTWSQIAGSRPEPVIRVWMRFWRTRKVSFEETKFFQEVESSPSDSPFRRKKNVFAFNLIKGEVRAKGTIKVVVRNKQGTFKFKFRYKPKETQKLIHPDCTARGLDIIPSKGTKGVPTYVAAYCEKSQKSKGKVFLTWGKESRLRYFKRRKKLVKSVQRTGPSAYFTLATPKDEVTLGRLIFRQRTRKKKNVASFNITYGNASPFSKKFFFSGGIGPTYYAYTEAGGLFSVSGFSATVKVATVRPLSSKWDLGANTFFGYTLSNNNAAANATNFYGVNARAAYVFKPGTSGMRWTFKAMGGVYMWGMLVPESQYGVTFLIGPQVYFLASTARQDAANMFFYFKFAPVGAFSLSNREIAVGGGYQLGARSKYSVNLNIAQTAASSATQDNDFTLLTFSLALGMRF